MSGRGKLPADYRVDALAVEATRRSAERGRSYSYGQLIADTTEEERDEIVEDFKRGFRRRRTGGTKSAFAEADTEG